MISAVDSKNISDFQLDSCRQQKKLSGFNSTAVELKINFQNPSPPLRKRKNIFKTQLYSRGESMLHPEQPTTV